MQNSVSFLVPVWQQKSLLSELISRDVSGRYRGSAFGVVWSLITPILMLAIYTFVFSVIFRSRWGGADESQTTFAINLFAGMIVHGFVAECINRAPGLILSNVNYVKRVVFPLELLAVVSLGSALFHAAIGLVVLMVFSAVIGAGIPLTVGYVVVVWLPLVLGVLGMSWFLSSLGVYLRDIGQITGLLTTILMFLSPVFYPATALPEPYRTVLYLNPLTFIIEQTRNVLILGGGPSWGGISMAFIIGWCMAWSGYAWFQKSRKGFADVL